MIEQVLLNLARNGLQSMEALCGPVEQRVLRLRVSVDGAGRIEFAVTDRGTGVPDDIAARLFTPFFTTRPGGLGLGLSMCRTVIEQHAGELGLRNVVDAGRCTGACFHFTLPAARGSAAEPAPRPDQETLHAR